MNQLEWEIEKSMELFHAVQMLGDEAIQQVGYNQRFPFAPGLTVTYELFDRGPEYVYFQSQFQLEDNQDGFRIDPIKERLSEEELYWHWDELFNRITIYAGKRAMCRIEGAGTCSMTKYEQGPWEEAVLNWYKADGRKTI